MFVGITLQTQPQGKNETRHCSICGNPENRRVDDIKAAYLDCLAALMASNLWVVRICRFRTNCIKNHSIELSCVITLLVAQIIVHDEEDSAKA